MSDFEQDLQQIVAQPTKVKELFAEWHERAPRESERHFILLYTESTSMKR